MASGGRLSRWRPAAAGVLCGAAPGGCPDFPAPDEPGGNAEEGEFTTTAPNFVGFFQSFFFNAATPWGAGTVTEGVGHEAGGVGARPSGGGLPSRGALQGPSNFYGCTE